MKAKSLKMCKVLIKDLLLVAKNLYKDFTKILIVFELRVNL